MTKALVGTTATKGVRNTLIQAAALNESAGLFWPSTVFVLLATLLWRRKSWPDWVLMRAVVMIPAFYFFYHSPESFFQGPLYYYELLLPLSILLARGILDALGGVRRAVGDTPAKLGGFALTALVISLIARFFVPTDAVGTAFGDTQVFNRNRLYLEMIHLQTTTLVDFNQALESEDVHNAVVFMPPTTGIYSNYGCDIGPLIYVNGPDFRGDIVYALDLSDEQNQKVMVEYPGRDFFAWRREYEGEPHRLIPLEADAVDLGP